MCSNSTIPAWENLKKPMPLSRKLHLIRQNLWTRISLHQICCGHPGEPGC